MFLLLLSNHHVILMLLSSHTHRMMIYQYWEKQVTPVLNAINSASKSDTEALCELCTNLWTVLQLSNTTGRSTSKSKHRSSVL